MWWWTHGPCGLGAAASVGICVCQSWGPGKHLRLCVYNPRVCCYMALACVYVCVYVLGPHLWNVLCVSVISSTCSHPHVWRVCVCVRTACDASLTCVAVLLSVSWGGRPVCPRACQPGILCTPCVACDAVTVPCGCSVRTWPCVSLVCTSPACPAGHPMPHEA